MNSGFGSTQNPSLSPFSYVLRFATLEGHIHIMICKIESVYVQFLCLPPARFHAMWVYCSHVGVGGNLVGHEQGVWANNVLFIRTNTRGSHVFTSSSANGNSDHTVSPWLTQNGINWRWKKKVEMLVLLWPICHFWAHCWNCTLLHCCAFSQTKWVEISS